MATSPALRFQDPPEITVDTCMPGSPSCWVGGDRAQACPGAQELTGELATAAEPTVAALDPD